MSDQKRLKVIIVGGSVAGLTLAHGLHHNNIDYVVLEAGKEMAPHVGASIVVCSNGMRVLDQLGIADDILAMVDPLRRAYTWTEDGKLLVDADAPILTGIRTGYPLAFLLRSDLLKVIAAHLPDQSRLHTSKRVVEIEHHEHGVTVNCQDGSRFSGDVVVGADGIHSIVRNQMQQHIESIKPGATAKDQAGLSSEYSCIYGFSKLIPGAGTPGDSHRTYSKNNSTLTFVGKDKLFWFFFSKLDKRYWGKDIPRFTQADCAEHAKKFFDLHMTDKIMYKEVWDNVIYANMLSLEELQIEHWTADRFVCLGDASHKMTPNLGAGGNSAIESAAALANSLSQLKNGSTSLPEIRLALKAFYDKRHPRANIICDAANQLTRIEALDTLPDKIMGIYAIPLLGDFLSDITCGAIVGAEIIECLPVPPRSLTATMPYDPTQGVGMEEKKWRRALYALPLLAIIYGCHRTMGASISQLAPKLIEALKSGGFELPSGEIVPVLRKFFGIKAVDRILSFYVALFTPSIGNLDAAGRAQGILFLSDLMPMQAIWMIESYRRGNFLTAAQLLPTILGFMYQVKGLGFIAPLYFFLHYVQSPLENYAAADNRMVQMGPVKTIIPTIVLSYILPSIAMLAAPSLADRQWINAVLWQPFPLYAAILQRFLAKTVRDTTQEDRKYNPEADMPYLRRTYIFAGIIAALGYTYVHFTSPVSLIEALFSGIRHPTSSVGLIKDISKALRYDHIATFSAGAYWTLLSFADLKRKNKIQSSWAKIFGVFAGTTFLAGPGAAMAAMWSWREECLVPKRVYSEWKD